MFFFFFKIFNLYMYSEYILTVYWNWLCCTCFVYFYEKCVLMYYLNDKGIKIYIQRMRMCCLYNYLIVSQTLSCYIFSLHKFQLFGCLFLFISLNSNVIGHWYMNTFKYMYIVKNVYKLNLLVLDLSCYRHVYFELANV